MTNMTEFNQFLTPILIPRIVGTENHTKVEEVKDFDEINNNLNSSLSKTR